MMENILLAFIPLFVTIDPIGVLPIFVSLTNELKDEERKRIIWQSLLTALSVAIGFIFLGKMIFAVLGITMGDFMIAGGVILFCIAIINLVQPEKVHRYPFKELGAVPIGTPLIIGPAALTTCLMMVDQHGLAATLFAVLANIIIVGAIFSSSNFFIRTIGQPGARVLSKVMALLLAAYAVMMIRKGIINFIHLS